MITLITFLQLSAWVDCFKESATIFFDKGNAIYVFAYFYNVYMLPGISRSIGVRDRVQKAATLDCLHDILEAHPASIL